MGSFTEKDFGPIYHEERNMFKKIRIGMKAFSLLHFLNFLLIHPYQGVNFEARRAIYPLWFIPHNELIYYYGGLNLMQVASKFMP